MTNAKEFLSQFITDGLGVQVGKLTQGTNGINWFQIIGDLDDIEKTIESNKNDDLYFQSGSTKDLNKKSSAEDVVKKNSCFIDVDIRKNYKELHNGFILSDEDMMKKIAEIKVGISRSELLNSWCSIVNSGNGCHIWYIGDWIPVDSEFTAEDYKVLVTMVYDEYAKIFPKGTDFYPDYSCRGIEKLARVPGSFNIHRKEKYGLEPKVAEVVFFQGVKSPLFTL